MEFFPEGDDVWLKFTSSIYTDYPLLTQSAFARAVCGGRELLASGRVSVNSPFPRAIHFTHEEPSYRAEYDRIFGVPLFFGSHMNALLLDKEFPSIKLPPPNPYLSQILTVHADELLKDLERSRS